jgi:CBS domain-containing protein
MRTENIGRRPQGRDHQPQNFGGNPPSLGSARSDYGDRAYGGGLNEQGMDRGWWDRTSDEVSSWFGDEEAERRRRMDERRDMASDRSYGRRYYGRGESERFYSDSADYYPAQFYARDWHNLRAGDVMIRGVMTVHPDDSALHAARMMGDCDCGAIPVVDWQNRMIGMITDRDITIRLVANGVNPAHARVAECMTNKVFACHVNDPIEECMRAMSRHQIRRMPIIDDRGHIAGIVSQADIAQHAAENRGAGERRAVTDVMCAISEPTPGSYS